MNSISERKRVARHRTPLNRSQIVGFWGAWAGWTLDGMDSFIYALVLTPALTELLPTLGLCGHARQCRTRRFDPVCAVSGRMGAVVHLGAAR